MPWMAVPRREVRTRAAGNVPVREGMARTGMVSVGPGMARGVTAMGRLVASVPRPVGMSMMGVAFPVFSVSVRGFMMAPAALSPSGMTAAFSAALATPTLVTATLVTAAVTLGRERLLRDAPQQQAPQGQDHSNAFSEMHGSLVDYLVKNSSLPAIQ